MPTYLKCMVIRTTNTITLPSDWDTTDNACWVFGAGGNGDDAAYACVGGGGSIHVPYAGSGGGGGEYATDIGIGGSPGGTLICTVGVAGGRPYGPGMGGVNRTIVDNGSGTTEAKSGGNASTSGPCINGGGIQGLGGTGGNDGGFGNSGFSFQNGGGGGNLWNGNGQNSADWTDALAATPDVWFDPAGSGLEYDTVATLFNFGGTPTYGGGGAGGNSGGVPTINGAAGYFPGGAGGGGASAGSSYGVGAVGTDGMIILYYNPTGPTPPPPLVGNSRRWIAEMGPVRVAP